MPCDGIEAVESVPEAAEKGFFGKRRNKSRLAWNRPALLSASGRAIAMNISSLDVNEIDRALGTVPKWAFS
ncbi:hypothetical protein CT19425_U500012 [Cupriavidus taiwanensis]|uniref:Uncharacterized protein n=1 Tax=Cupriavidus taiwanensis TaxID=164546 RepID=A0A375I6D6_9BURK|nr:hypothetical protein CT19425_U500012 [Cupriavidus taiwanensis]